MPAGSTQQPPIGLCRRQGRASRLRVPRPPTSATGAPACKYPVEYREEGLATKPADRAAGLAGGHAGRLDPAASHRPGPTAGPLVPCLGLRIRVSEHRGTWATSSWARAHLKMSLRGGIWRACSPEMRPRGAEMGPEIARERLRRAGPPAAPATGLHLSHSLARAPCTTKEAGGGSHATQKNGSWRPGDAPRNRS